MVSVKRAFIRGAHCWAGDAYNSAPGQVVRNRMGPQWDHAEPQGANPMKMGAPTEEQINRNKALLARIAAEGKWARAAQAGSRVYTQMKGERGMLTKTVTDESALGYEQALPVAPANPPVRPVTKADTDAAFDAATDVQSAFDAMSNRCEELKGNETARRSESRKAGAMTPDRDVLWQGDVGVVLLSDKTFKNLKPNLKPLTEGGSHVQVAVGTGIGARHMVSTAECSVFARQGTPLEGPVVVADGPWTLSHPEHQNCEFPPGTYGIVYQRQFAEELRRAAD